MNRHAYLIMCHNNFEILEKLLILLDHEENDLYIHVDKKAGNFSQKAYKTLITKARVFFTKRINVNWAGHSQIKAEMILLKEAVKNEHSYYHLITGVDFPIKSHEQIMSFFENKNKQYIKIDPKSRSTTQYLFRVKNYYLLQDIIGRNRGAIFSLLSKLEQAFLRIQQKIGIDRTKGCQFTFYKGSPYFSITHDLARFIVDHERFIRKHFYFGLGVDEFFVQTLAMMSPYKDCVVDYNARHIDWNRGDPYTFTNDDYAELLESKCLFARKFDYTKDSRIVNRLFENLNG